MSSLMEFFTSIGALILILFLNGAASIPMSYVLSFLTETSASGFALLSILNIITGAIAPVVVYLLNFFGEVNDISSLLIASDVIRYIMVPFPSFPMARAIMALIQVGNKK